jgi:hypothetical protein
MDFAGDSRNTMVPPVAGPAAGLEGTGAFFAAAGCEGRFAVGNIIVRPAASSDVGGTGAAGDRGGLPAAAACDGGFAGGGMLFGRGGAAKIAVAFGWGSFVGAGGTRGGSAAAAPGGITLKTFWHFPQRMLRPCGPIRASSTR